LQEQAALRAGNSLEHSTLFRLGSTRRKTANDGRRHQTRPSGSNAKTESDQRSSVQGIGCGILRLQHPGIKQVPCFRLLVVAGDERQTQSINRTEAIPLSVSGVGSGGLAVGDRNADRPADIVLANSQTNQVSNYLSKEPAFGPR